MIPLRFLYRQKLVLYKTPDCELKSTSWNLIVPKSRHFPKAGFITYAQIRWQTFVFQWRFVAKGVHATNGKETISELVSESDQKRIKPSFSKSFVGQESTQELKKVGILLKKTKQNWVLEGKNVWSDLSLYLFIFAMTSLILKQVLEVSKTAPGRKGYYFKLFSPARINDVPELLESIYIPGRKKPWMAEIKRETISLIKHFCGQKHNSVYLKESYWCKC